MELCAASAIGLFAEVRDAPHCGQYACLNSTIDPHRVHGPLSLTLRLVKSKLGTSGRNRDETPATFGSGGACSVRGKVMSGVRATVPVPAFVTIGRGALSDA